MPPDFMMADRATRRALWVCPPVARSAPVELKKMIERFTTECRTCAMETYCASAEEAVFYNSRGLPERGACAWPGCRQFADGVPGGYCNNHHITSVVKKDSPLRANESFLTKEGFVAIRGQIRERCREFLADMTHGVWDPDEQWQVMMIGGRKHVLFKKGVGPIISRGIASVMIRGQTRVASIVTEFIDGRIALGENPWCQRDGISLPMRMKSMTREARERRKEREGRQQPPLTVWSFGGHTPWWRHGGGVGGRQS